MAGAPRMRASIRALGSTRCCRFGSNLTHLSHKSYILVKRVSVLLNFIFRQIVDLDVNNIPKISITYTPIFRVTNSRKNSFFFFFASCLRSWLFSPFRLECVLVAGTLCRSDLWVRSPELYDLMLLCWRRAVTKGNALLFHFLQEACYCYARSKERVPRVGSIRNI